MTETSPTVTVAEPATAPVGSGGPPMVADPPIGGLPPRLLDAVVDGPDIPHPTLPANRSLDLLHGVEMTVTVELGRTKLPVRDLLALRCGSIIELDRAAGSPVDVLINGTLLAHGEVVVVDDEFGVRITDIVSGDDHPIPG